MHEKMYSYPEGEGRGWQGRRWKWEGEECYLVTATEKGLLGLEGTGEEVTMKEVTMEEGTGEEVTEEGIEVKASPDVQWVLRMRQYQKMTT